MDQNGGTNLAAGQAVLANFTALVATNQITGNVKFNGTNVVGLGVSAFANINGVNYNVNTVDTDTNGNYSLTVASGNWNVQIYDCGCGDDDSLNQVVDGGINQGIIKTPISQNVNIANNNGTANFTVPFCGGVSIVTPSPLPAGTNGVYYSFNSGLGLQQQFHCGTVAICRICRLGCGLDSERGNRWHPIGSGTYNFSVHVGRRQRSHGQPIIHAIHRPDWSRRCKSPRLTCPAARTARFTARHFKPPAEHRLIAGSFQTIPRACRRI